MHTTARITIGAAMVLGSALAASAPSSATGETIPASPGEPIPLTDVEEVSIEGIGRATVAIGSPAELTITGPADAVDQLAVAVDEGELAIEPAAEAVIELGDGEELVYDITVESLTDVGVGGTVSLAIDGVTSTELGIDLRDTATGSIANVDVEEVDAGVQGTAVLRIAGSTAALDVDARESGAFDGTELAAGTAEVDARESARVVVNASTLLEADVRDSAVVEHVGAPAETELDVRDAGQVRPATGSLIPAPPDVAGSVPVASPPASAPATPGTSPGTQPAEPAALEVRMAGRAFSPGTLEISVGDTVTWINDDDTEHTVTAFEGAFDSGELAEGATFSFTFDTPGEYSYRCLFHSEMQGTIVVT